MSREIKFRAWRKDINKMISAGVPIVEEGAKLELIFGDSRYAWVFVEPELSMVMGTPRDSELMQFTGLPTQIQRRYTRGIFCDGSIRLDIH